VESGVEHRDLGQARKNGFTGCDAGQVGRIVKWRDGDARLDSCPYAGRDERGIGELLAAVNHAVSDGIDLDLVLEETMFGMQERVFHRRHSLRMVLGHNLQHELGG
jgi:hypothetical protein